MANIKVQDSRTPVTALTVATAPIGAIVSYPLEDGTRRRAVIVHRTPKSLTLLDGDQTIKLTGERRDNLRVLAASANAYTQRVADETERLRNEYNWCGVPSAFVRDINSTPVAGTGLIVVARGVQVFELEPTGMTRRRENIANAIASAFVPNDIGFFGDRHFKMVHKNQSRKFGLELVDTVPAQL